MNKKEHDEILLERAGESSRELLFRLLQYSLYEESGTDGNEMNENGLFDYPWFDAYFSEPGREAWLIRNGGGKLLGFAMVNEHVQKVSRGHSIAEFMILPGCRRKGAGSEAARLCFETHRGNWEVSPAAGSSRAKQFWDSVISHYTGGRYELCDGIFSFFTDESDRAEGERP